MIFAAMSRWQPIASMVTTAPSIDSMSMRAGMATISSDFSFTFVCASTRRCRAAKAETMWMGAFALPADRRTLLPSMAMSSTGVLVSAAPNRQSSAGSLGVERGEDVAQLSWAVFRQRTDETDAAASASSRPNRAMPAKPSAPARTANSDKSRTS